LLGIMSSQTVWESHILAERGGFWQGAKRGGRGFGLEAALSIGFWSIFLETSSFLLCSCRILPYNRRVQINLSNDSEVLVLKKAEAAGFGEDVAAYVAHLIAADGFAPLADEELQASLAMIDAGMEEIAAGGGLTVDQARQHSLEQLKRNPL